MHMYKDPTGITRLAIIAVWTHLAAIVGLTASMWYLYSTEAFIDPETLMALGTGQLVLSVLIFAAMIVVGIWIYRVSANAHTLSDEMTISPGWAVGWYFVPIANLFKPFQAMKEVWLASHFRGNWHGEPTPGLLGWWWALWIVTNILSSISFRIGVEQPEVLAPGPVVALDGLGTLLTVPLCLILIRMMQQLSHAQLHARHDETFA